MSSAHRYPESVHAGRPANDAGQEKATVLLVEDEALILFPLADFMRDLGYTVMEAASADEARSVLARNRNIDLVFSDISMPGATNGFALANWIYRERPDVKVLLTSGAANLRQLAAEQHHEASTPILRKPYDYDVLRRRIEDLLHS
jgi:DNA-binding NtrC family response regulator